MQAQCACAHSHKSSRGARTHTRLTGATELRSARSQRHPTRPNQSNHGQTRSGIAHRPHHATYNRASLQSSATMARTRGGLSRPVTKKVKPQPVAVGITRYGQGGRSASYALRAPTLRSKYSSWRVAMYKSNYTTRTELPSKPYWCPEAHTPTCVKEIIPVLWTPQHPKMTEINAAKSKSNDMKCKTITKNRKSTESSSHHSSESSSDEEVCVV